MIGAGPAGSTTARVVAEGGHQVLIIDRNHFAGERTICGGGVNLIEVQRQGISLPPSVEEKRVAGSVWYFPWLVHEWKYKKADYVSAYRRVFDRYLCEQAIQRGARLQERTSVEQVHQGDNEMVVATRGLDTHTLRTFTSKLVVFADGPATLARKMVPSAGFSCEPTVTAHGAIYELKYIGHEIEFLEFHFDPRVSPWGYGWVFPKNDVLNVGVMCLMEKATLNIREYLDYFVNHHPATAGRLNGGVVRFFGADIVPLAPATHIHGERFAVVGDAAGSVEAFTGEGIKQAMVQGTILGKVVTEAMEANDCSEDFLVKYAERWFASTEYKELRTVSRLSRLVRPLATLDPYAYHKLVALHMYGGLRWRRFLKSLLTIGHPYSTRLRRLLARLGGL